MTFEREFLEWEERMLIEFVKQGFHGLDSVVRLHLYELLLHVCPLGRSKWESDLASRSALYWGWVGKYFLDRERWLNLDFPAEGVTQKGFGFGDNDTMAQIQGNLGRTRIAHFARLHLGATGPEIRPAAFFLL
jgi:hypothetical protein